jgi:membrane-bound lytic murein transglycosylase B
VFLASSVFSGERPSFQAWVTDVRLEAKGKGISQATLDAAFTDLTPIPKVIELDRNQPEFKLTLEQYLDRVVTQTRVASGRKNLSRHKTLLADVSQRYGVGERFIVALWGIETSFGQRTGKFPVIDAVATLAYDGRRSRFFRKELFHALQILEARHISAEEMLGSWAGAMGQFQFMPSSFQSYAVDYEGDGCIDIWNNLGDAFASAANYLSRSGWVKDQIWGREVRLPEPFDPALIGLNVRKHLSEWHEMGLVLVDGRNLPSKPDLSASVVAPDGIKGRTFVVYNNYRVFLRWNRSHYFAVAASTLADRIAGP